MCAPAAFKAAARLSAARLRVLVLPCPHTRTIADPAGLFELWANDWSLIEPYRFGSRTADYLVCRRCGVYLAAVCETSAGTRAVVNTTCLADRAVSDYDGETAEMRLARRAVNWMPAIMSR